MHGLQLYAKREGTFTYIFHRFTPLLFLHLQFLLEIGERQVVCKCRELCGFDIHNFTLCHLWLRLFSLYSLSSFLSMNFERDRRGWWLHGGMFAPAITFTVTQSDLNIAKFDSGKYYQHTYSRYILYLTRKKSKFCLCIIELSFFIFLFFFKVKIQDLWGKNKLLNFFKFWFLNRKKSWFISDFKLNEEKICVWPQSYIFHLNNLSFCIKLWKEDVKIIENINFLIELNFN